MVWQENHLTCEEAGYDVIGVANPGVPMILIGHNKSMAWGITLSYTDADDLYLERFTDWNDKKYTFNGQTETADVIRETIEVLHVFSKRSTLTHI